MRWLLGFFGVCQHAHYRRERTKKGALLLVCDNCGRTVPAIERTAKERKQIAERFTPVKASKAMPMAGKVTSMRQRRTP